MMETPFMKVRTPGQAPFGSCNPKSAWQLPHSSTPGFCEGDACPPLDGAVGPLAPQNLFGGVC